MNNSRTIQLDREHVERLDRLAHAASRSIGDIVHDAVDDYLERHALDAEAWRARLFDVVGRLRDGIPPGERPEVIVCEITAARENIRADRAAGSG